MRAERVVAIYLGSGAESIKEPSPASTGERLDWAVIAGSSACSQVLGDLTLRVRNPREEHHVKAQHVQAAFELSALLVEALVAEHDGVDIEHVGAMANGIVYSLLEGGTCGACGGAGRVVLAVAGGASRPEQCSRCEGTGKIRFGRTLWERWTGIPHSTWHRCGYGQIAHLWRDRLLAAESDFVARMLAGTR